MNKVLLSSKSDIWSTPKDLYNHFISKGFFDPCPLNPSFDGLSISWGDRAFVNPPYSDIKNWVKKSIKEKNKGCDVWLLIPARTDTKWFKELYEDNNFEFIFLSGRLKFGGSKTSAPFPSMLVHGNIRIDYHYMILMDNTFEWLYY